MQTHGDEGASSWPSYQRLVVNFMGETGESIGDIRRDIVQLRLDQAVLATKVAIYAAIAAFVSSAVAAVIVHYATKERPERLRASTESRWPEETPRRPGP